MYKYLALCTFVLICSTTVFGEELLKEQQTTQLQAVADAHRDAKRVINGTFWRFTGFFGSIFGVGASLVYEPPLPASALVGKTPEYVVFYTTEFHRETQGLQLYHASTGCVSGGVLGLMLWLII